VGRAPCTDVGRQVTLLAARRRALCPHPGNVVDLVEITLTKRSCPDHEYIQGPVVVERASTRHQRVRILCPTLVDTPTWGVSRVVTFPMWR